MKTAAWFLVLSSWFVVSVYALAVDDCNHKLWTWRVDKKAAHKLQQFVNHGHEPWRLDDVATVAENAIDAQKGVWADRNTILKTPKVTSQTNDTALLVSTSEDGGIYYEVVLRKPAWLLHDAHDNWDWVVWLPTSVERIECVASPH